MARCCSTVAIGFDAYAIGGLSVGEPPPVMYDVVEYTSRWLPGDRPRYVMGLGDPALRKESLGLRYRARSGEPLDRLLVDAFALVREAGRVPAQRNTEYELIRVYERPEDDEDSPLDHIGDAEARFGSYKALAGSGRFRYLHPLRTTAPS